jgi:hypothetical protein
MKERNICDYCKNSKIEVRHIRSFSYEGQRVCRKGLEPVIENNKETCVEFEPRKSEIIYSANE